ncbi:ABC-F family ATP-binding cassette domain-containing protein [Microbispora sp. RL4-1S]|uniref:ABC-F family ATP-binding cassette domain-containing protein n=1 Tax=Microbispora oryzae TaxID=2806554 RepID=A0A941AQ33_9ACTN|nr:ATP-binding cassette domain-containing protein [Microbispora oryzae]MBP2704309.1 ABC-F family ATP-binding cassette domain-containing protein [Microbispora oryzae]
MPHVEVTHLTYVLPDGRPLLDDVSFRVGDGVKAALVGPNGAGKTTLLRLVSGDLRPIEGSVAHSGGLGVMRQFVGSLRGTGQATPGGDGRDSRTVQDLLLSVAPERVRQAAARLHEAELAMMEREDEKTQMRYAQAITDYTDAGGYDIEVLWDACTVAALGAPYDNVKYRDVATLSGGEQKRLVLEALLRGPDQVLLLDEPDNYLDVPGKIWLEQALRDTPKTVLLVSHDRQLLANAADRIVTVESGNVWIHGGGFATYAEARRERNERLDELRRRWDEEHAKLRRLVLMLKQKASNNDGMAPAYHAAQTRLRRFEEAGPPELAPKDQFISMRLRGGRTGKRSVIAEGLELTGLMKPFDLEVWYGERLAVLGSNGSGKSHFLRLLAGEAIRHTGTARLGARVVPGHFAQTHARPELLGRTPCEIVMTEHARLRNEAMKALARYELAGRIADQRFETLSGGQQARLQILLLELSGATLLLLDEPTDNLDLASAEALQEGLGAFAGTVLAVTHDRWFAADFDRFLVFGADGRVYESPEPVWDEKRVARAR